MFSTIQKISGTIILLFLSLGPVAFAALRSVKQNYPEVEIKTANMRATAEFLTEISVINTIQIDDEKNIEITFPKIKKPRKKLLPKTK